jgi:hypothetical protein
MAVQLFVAGLAFATSSQRIDSFRKLGRRDGGRR